MVVSGNCEHSESDHARGQPTVQRREAKAVLEGGLPQGRLRPDPAQQRRTDTDRPTEQSATEVVDEPRREHSEQDRGEPEHVEGSPEQDEEHSDHVRLAAAVVLSPVERREVPVEDPSRHQGDNSLVRIDGLSADRPQAQEQSD